MKSLNSGNCLVAYLDIMGYSSIVKNGKADVYYNAINNVLSEWSKHFTPEIIGKYVLARSMSQNLFFEVFSDSFVIAVDEDEVVKALKKDAGGSSITHSDPPTLIPHAFSYLICYLAKDMLLNTEHLVRGAIGRGPFYSREFNALSGNSFVFSSTLSEAYELSENMVDTPRIVLLDSIFRGFKPKDFFSSQPISTAARDEDGLYYLNTYGPMTLSRNINISDFIKAKQIIDAAILKFETIPEIKRKWVWFASYHNMLIKRIVMHSSNSTLYPEYSIFKQQEASLLISF